MSKQKVETNRTQTAEMRDEPGNLDRQYGSIGISAVAAALPYAGTAKNSGSFAREDDDRHSNDRKRSVLAV
jgi:hypothetical protein